MLSAPDISLDMQFLHNTPEHVITPDCQREGGRDFVICLDRDSGSFLTFGLDSDCYRIQIKSILFDTFTIRLSEGTEREFQ